MSPRLALWCLLLAVVGFGVVPFLKKEPSELPVYILGADRMLEGAEIYRPSDPKPFAYPPFFGLVFAPFADASRDVARVAWYFLNIAILAWLVVLVRRWYRLALKPTARATRGVGVLFGVLVAAMSFRHVLAVFSNQSHDLIVCALVAASTDAWMRAATIRSGIWAGLGAACKATPALFLTLFVLAKSPKALLGLVAAAALATWLPDLLAPREDGGSWAVAFYDVCLSGLSAGKVAAADGVWYAGSILNQSLAGTLYRLTTPVTAEAMQHPFAVEVSLGAASDSMRRIIQLAGQGFVVLMVALAAWRGSVGGNAGATTGEPQDAEFARRRRRLGQCAAVACGMVLLSPMSSKSHFCVLLLPATYLALELLEARTRQRSTLFLWVGIFLLVALGSLTSKGILGRTQGNLLLAYGVITWATCLALVWTVIRVCRRDSATG